MNNIIRDCGEIWNRLFDHRPFLTGEILYFQEEFEVKRNDREVSKLFEALEKLTDIKDTKFDKLHNLCEITLSNIQGKLDTALNSSQAILDNEYKYDIDSNLEIKREIRKEEWERFQSEIKQKYTKIDETFNTREKELREFYVHLDSCVLKTPVSNNKD